MFEELSSTHSPPSTAVAMYGSPALGLTRLLRYLNCFSLIYILLCMLAVGGFCWIHA
ncbi:hypothetical protein AXF42_Ash017309 [Apostasia shenzhenica]|uniref:Uncharacterized protein n=1 Tax=Apostasia shenzhenica TaxID=1088818 RepID=A0A2I0BDB3_9ASPA|nr:hypothetical protein AXF42_Ash017309 [Apostasia shenzhenica]